MVQIVFFTDPGKDGDDLLATIHIMMQAKAYGLIDPLTTIQLVTTDEIPCDQYGNPTPDGKYGLRALYLKMQIERLQKELHYSPQFLPEVITGPISSYYSYDEHLQKYHHEATKSDAFYPVVEVQKFYKNHKLDLSCCLLNPKEQPDVWIEKVRNDSDKTTLINIASFNAIVEFLEHIPKEIQEKYTILSMGYNKPYSNDEYTSKVEDVHKLPYNSRSTDVSKASPAFSALIRNNAFHVVSGSTRSLFKYTEGVSIKGFADIMARSYPLLTGRFAPSFLISMIEFIKSSRYKGFWPHDVVPSLMALIQLIDWNKKFGFDIDPKMMFTEISQIPARELRLRTVNKTGILIDSTVPEDIDDMFLNHEGHFIYGNKIDIVFFTSLQHLIALESIRDTKSDLFKCYQEILKLKAELYQLRQNQETDPEREKRINSLWIKANLMELQRQLEQEARLILNQKNHPVSRNVEKDFAERSYNSAQRAILSAELSEAENKNTLVENLLQWSSEIKAFLDIVERYDLPESMIQDINTALQNPTTEKNITP